MIVPITSDLTGYQHFWFIGIGIILVVIIAVCLLMDYRLRTNNKLIRELIDLCKDR